MRKGFVYILTNVNNNVLYTGVTNDLISRIFEHKNKTIEGFTKKYNLFKLVYSPTQKTPGLSLGMNAQGQREGIKRGTASEEFRSSSREPPGFKPGELHFEVLRIY